MNSKVSIVIPNYNGKAYLPDCLNALREQTLAPDLVIVVDNGSTDGSLELLDRDYPEAVVAAFPENTGFCGAVNEGIRRSIAAGMDYVILLNNDTAAERDFTKHLVRAMDADRTVFSAQAKMLRMTDPTEMDDAGDLYCALGWAFARGKGKPAANYTKTEPIFSACAGAAIYRVSILKEIGLFDENHFAYLEDCDIGWRARIHGYKNLFVADAPVRHVGSATSGSVYNLFKVRNTSRNSIYLISKNMPLLQILINLPFLIPGFIVKAAFFAVKGFGKEYIMGIGRGFALSRRGAKEGKKVRFEAKHLKDYIRIQWELWVNTVRRFAP